MLAAVTLENSTRTTRVTITPSYIATYRVRSGRWALDGSLIQCNLSDAGMLDNAEAFVERMGYDIIGSAFVGRPDDGIVQR